MTLVLEPIAPHRFLYTVSPGRRLIHSYSREKSHASAIEYTFLGRKSIALLHEVDKQIAAASSDTADDIEGVEHLWGIQDDSDRSGLTLTRDGNAGESVLIL